MRAVATLSLGIALVAAGSGAVLAACAVTDGDDDEPAARGTAEPFVDERAGVLGGVRFGDSEDDVRRRLGEPTDDEDGFFPSGEDYTGPPAIPSPHADQRSRVPPTPLHYGSEAYLVSPNVGVYSMATLAEDASTSRGVSVGDDLDRARDRYGGMRCGEAVAGEPLFGGDTPTYEWCRAVVNGVRVFFGGDPIASITLTRYREETE